MVAFATQVKRRRGTTAQNDAFTGAEGEIVVDTEKHTLRVHDGVTLGGFEMATEDSLGDKADVAYVNAQLTNKADTDLSNIPDNYDYVVESQLPTADNGYTWYRKYKSGWVEQGGISTGTGTRTPTLPIEMASSNYNISAMATRANADAITVAGYGAVSTTRLVMQVSTINLNNYTWNSAAEVRWQVSGMSAQ